MLNDIKSIISDQLANANKPTLERLPKTSGNQKRVGVLTLPFNVNIGGNLQGYALMEVLRQLGHLPVLICRRGWSNDIDSDDEAAAKDAKMPLITNKYTVRHHLNQEFVEKHIVPITRLFSSTGELRRNIDRYEFDAVVVGSDQVWRPKYVKDMLVDFFLGFIDKRNRNIRRISYAASFGVGEWEYNADQTKLAASLVSLFDAVSVREDVAVDLCQRNLGVAATHVLDPTMLLTADHYVSLLLPKSGRVGSGQLLAYVLDSDPHKTKLIKMLSSRLGVESYSTNGLPLETAADAEGDKSVEGWLASIYDANFVVTDSFHGTVFSILFNKPFLAYGNRHRGMARFSSLLKMFELEDRLITELDEIDIDKILQPVDWDAVNQRLERLRVQSKQFLISALSQDQTKIEKYQRPKDLQKENVKSGVKSVLDRPVFSTNNAVWSVKPQDGFVMLRVSAGGAVRGNYVWCDLPFALSERKTYRLYLTWRVRTTIEILDVHVRNKTSGKFRPIGKISVSGRQFEQRVDVFDFVAPGEGFNQFMLGAVYFTGENAGADIIRISLQEEAAATKLQEEASATKKPKTFAEVAQDLALNDSKRYAETFASSEAARGLGLVRARMMFYAHALEKGLSHSNFRPRFGGRPVRNMADEMSKWLKEGRSKDDPFFKAAAATARAYFERHHQLNVNVSDLFEAFDPPSRALIMRADDDDGGVLTAEAPREAMPETSEDRKFMDVVFGRRSVREFTSMPVNDEDIRRAVRIAQQAPSVCNRQGARVHQFDEPEAIRAAVDLQGGFRGYEMPPKLLLVTTDLAAFLTPYERNQSFIDGGLFMMTLLLGLEQVGLGACPLNTAMSLSSENAIRKILDIQETEIFISFIAVGHFDPAVLTPRSKRIAVDDVLIRHNR